MNHRGMNHSGSVAATAAASTPTGDAVPKLSALASVVWNKAIILLKRYAFNTITQMVSVYFLFLVVFFGARGITAAVGGSPIALGDTLDATIVGFFLWFLALASYAELAYSIMNEARLGTLEQLMMSPFGFRWVAVFEVAASTVTSLVMSGFVLAAMLVTTGRQLQIDFITIVPLLLLVTVTAFGMGFMLAGLALIYKRIDALFQVMQFVFIILIGAPAFVSSTSILSVLPLSLTTSLIHEAMTDGTFLTELGAARLLTALVNAAVYFGVGLYVFGRMERKARLSGTLAQY